MSKKVLNSIIIISLIISFFLGRIVENNKLFWIRKNSSKIAKWVFEVDGGGEEIKQISILEPENNIAENSMLAPGSKGKFKICINSKGSEVNIKYKINFENEINKPRNLKYKFNGKIVDNIKELEPLLTGILNKEENNKEYIIEWEWQNTSDNPNHDLIDIEDGQTLDEYSFEIMVIGEKL